MNMEILITLAISLGINLIMFIPAFLLKTDKLTDISYAMTFLAVALSSLFLNQIYLYSLILMAMIFVWALRLGLFLLIRVRKIGKDKRFDDKRSNFWKFGKFWVLQGISVWIIMIPSVLFLSKDATSLSSISYLGVIIWALGLVIEAVADIQKYIFKNKPENKERWIEIGLWKYSRHPNYFGEIALWFGIYFFVLPGLTFWESIIGLVGPLYIASLILFISGIPLLEKSADSRWGNLADYQAYKKRTSLIIPRFN